MIMKTKDQFTEAGWQQVAIRKCSDCAWQKPEEKQCISCMIMKTKEQFTEVGWADVRKQRCQDCAWQKPEGKQCINCKTTKAKANTASMPGGRLKQERARVVRSFRQVYGNVQSVKSTPQC